MKHANMMAVALAALTIVLSGCHAPDTASRLAAPSLAQVAANGIRRTLIGRHPAHEPGWETRLYLVEYSPGATAPAHDHPAPGIGWIIEGVAESAFGEAPVVRIRAGEGFVDLAGVPHRVFRNASADRPLRFVVAYTLRAVDEPLRISPE